MRQHLCFTFVLVSALTATSIHARDDRLHFPIEAGLQVDGKSELDPDIKLFFGDQKHPKAQKTIGNFTSNKKTNAVGKSDETACNWAFLSAVIALQNRAKKEGGNALINITSYYKKEEFRSSTEFECGAGSMMAGVTLQGDVVILP